MGKMSVSVDKKNAARQRSGDTGRLPKAQTYIDTTVEGMGQLTPTSGGDIIPLLRPELKVGRRTNCDIVLSFSNVSGNHCLLELEDGYWFVIDQSSSNGTKVDGIKLAPGCRKRLDPGCRLSISRVHHYQVEYNPQQLGASGPPPVDDVMAMPKKSFLEILGMKRR